MRIGMIGLGRMGGGMAERLRRRGHVVVGYDRDPDARDVDTLEALAEEFDGESRRIAWSMVPAGAPTDDTIAALGELLGAGDLVVDGANSNFHDSQRHAADLAERGIGFVDAGVSGGVWGLEEGYCIMAGGQADDVASLRPVFDALVTEDGFAHVGPAGAGHFTKMVHNGVEYGLMQAYAEGYELLQATDLDVDVPAAIEVWRHGSVVRSWLLDLLADATADDPGLASVRGWVEDSGEGRWTVEQAVELGCPPRDVRQLSQRDLAERMTSLGHRWYQNTVSATETGERILGIDEVFDLTIALETSLPRLLDPRGVVGSGPAMIQVGGWATTTQHFADLQRFDRLPVRWTGNDRWEPQGVPEDPAWNEAAHRLRADVEDLDRRAAALRESAGPDLANVRVLVAALVHRMPFHLVLEIAEEVRNLRSRYDEPTLGGVEDPGR